jgi:hypothetical protein
MINKFKHKKNYLQISPEDILNSFDVTKNTSFSLEKTGDDNETLSSVKYNKESHKFRSSLWQSRPGLPFGLF